MAKRHCSFPISFLILAGCLHGNAAQIILPSSPSPCEDYPNWVARGGSTCATFVTNNFCTPTGGYGTGWKSIWGTFSSFTYDGLDCTQACCGCGKDYRISASSSPSPLSASCSPSPRRSPSVSPPASPVSCYDYPENWKDLYQNPCRQYVSANWCTSTGGYGSGWKTSYGQFSDFAVNGIAAPQACCACGGGVKTSPSRSGSPSGLPSVSVSESPASPSHSPVSPSPSPTSPSPSPVLPSHSPAASGSVSPVSRSPSTSHSTRASDSLSQSPLHSPSAVASPSQSGSPATHQTPSGSAARSPSASPFFSLSEGRSMSPRASGSTIHSSSANALPSTSPSTTASHSIISKLSPSTSAMMSRNPQPSASMSPRHNSSGVASPAISASPSSSPVSRLRSPSSVMSPSSSMRSIPSVSTSTLVNSGTMRSNSPMQSHSQSPSGSASHRPSDIPTPSPSGSMSRIVNGNPSPSPSRSIWRSLSVSSSQSPSMRAGQSPLASPSSSPSGNANPSPSRSMGPSSSGSISPISNGVPVPLPNASPSSNPSGSPSPIPSRSPSPSPNGSPSPIPSGSVSPQLSPGPSPPVSPSMSPVGIPLPSQSPSVSMSLRSSAGVILSKSPGPTASPTPSTSPVQGVSPSTLPSASPIPSESPSPKPSPSPWASPRTLSINDDDPQRTAEFGPLDIMVLSPVGSMSPEQREALATSINKTTYFYYTDGFVAYVNTEGGLPFSLKDPSLDVDAVITSWGSTNVARAVVSRYAPNSKDFSSFNISAPNATVNMTLLFLAQVERMTTNGTMANNYSLRLDLNFSISSITNLTCYLFSSNSSDGELVPPSSWKSLGNGSWSVTLNHTSLIAIYGPNSTTAQSPSPAPAEDGNGSNTALLGLLALLILPVLALVAWCWIRKRRQSSSAEPFASPRPLKDLEQGQLTSPNTTNLASQPDSLTQLEGPEELQDSPHSLLSPVTSNGIDSPSRARMFEAPPIAQILEAPSEIMKAETLQGQPRPRVTLNLDVQEHPSPQTIGGYDKLKLESSLLSGDEIKLSPPRYNSPLTPANPFNVARKRALPSPVRMQEPVPISMPYSGSGLSTITRKDSTNSNPNDGDTWMAVPVNSFAMAEGEFSMAQFSTTFQPYMYPDASAKSEESIPSPERAESPVTPDTPPPETDDLESQASDASSMRSMLSAASAVLSPAMSVISAAFSIQDLALANGDDEAMYTDGLSPLSSPANSPRRRNYLL